MTGHVHKLAVPLCVACLGLAACGSTDGGSTDSGTSSAGSAGSAGDSGTTTLRFAAGKQGGGYPTPFGAVRGPGRLRTTFVFDTLAFPDVTGEPKPWLAKSWQQDASGTTWTFQLHKANWQDGKPLTSADVAFSFDYQINGPGAKSGAAQGLDYIKSVTADGPERVVFKLKSPRPDFLDSIAGAFGVAIIPKHIWSKVTDPGRFQGKRALIGSGPYRLKSFDTTTNTFDFVANKDFYLGRPKVQEIQLVTEANPLLALQRGQLDSASGGNGVIPKPLFEQLSKRFKVLTAPGEFNEALFFNVDGGFPYTERAFRQGVAYALNRRNMLQVLVNGRGVPGSAGGLGPSNPFLNKDAPAYAFDKGKAAALLDKVGLKLPKGATFRVKPDGSAFTIPLLTSSADNQQAMLVQQYLRAVGLNSKLKSVDQPTSDAADAKGNYKMAVVHFGGLAGDPSVLVQRFASYSKGKSFTRVSGYRNPAFDKLAKQQTTTIDKAARRKLVDQMQVILATDVPEIPLYIPQQVSFVNPKVFSGWAYTPGCPPCGAGMNKRMLVSGSNAPVPGN